MKIAIAGTGYVGLVTAVCLARYGHTVTCVDVDENKIKLLQSGKSPIYEQDLEKMMQQNVKGEEAQKMNPACDATKVYNVYVGEIIK